MLSSSLSNWALQSSMAATEYPSLVKWGSLYRLIDLCIPSLSNCKSNSAAKEVGFPLSLRATSLSRAFIAAKAVHLDCRTNDFKLWLFSYDQISVL